MAKKFLVPIDLGKNELLNSRIQNLASAPSSPVSGQQYYDTTLGKFGVYNGTDWDYMGTSEASGDVSSNTSSSVDGEVALFSGTGGKTIKRATGTGLAKLTSGVLSTATAGTDYAAASHTHEGDDIVPDGDDNIILSAPEDIQLKANSVKIVSADGTVSAELYLGNLSGPTSIGLPDGGGNLANSVNGVGAANDGSITLAAGQVGALPDTSTLSDIPAGSGIYFDGSQQINDLAEPTDPQQAATKNYVDNAVQGLSWKTAVRVATTANGTLASAYEDGDTVDGVTLATGDRILLKDQTTGADNGIYVVNASGAPTRAADADTSAEIDSMTVYVEQGTANADTVWTLTTDNPTLGTTALVYAQVNGGSVPSASTSVAGKVELATQAEAQAKTDTVRAVTPASLADFARKYTGTIGDGSSTSIAVTHGLGSQYVTAQVFDATSNALVECDVTLTSSTQTTFVFAVAPTSNQYRVVIVG